MWREKSVKRRLHVLHGSSEDAVVGSSGHDETPETHTPVRALGVHAASVNAVECVFLLTLVHIYTQTNTQLRL